MHSKPVRALDISSDGGTIVAAVDNAIHLHEASTLRLKSTFSNAVQGDDICFLDQDRRLVLRGGNRLALVELEQGRDLMTIAHATVGSHGFSLKVHPRRDNIAVASHNQIAIYRFIPVGVPLPTGAGP